MSIKSPQVRYQFRKLRTRASIFGTQERPRLSVRRTSKHIYVQIVDDSAGRTLAAASTLDPDLRKKLKTGADVSAAKAVGQLVAQRAKAAGLALVVFDRGGYPYHGRVKAVADGAREAGLQF